jgi:hypothetical protein
MEWRRANAERLKAYNRAWGKGNPQKKRAHDRRYREKNQAQDPQGYRQRKRAQDQRYRERKRARLCDPPPEATAAQPALPPARVPAAPAQAHERREMDQEHNARSRALSNAVARESGIAQVAAGTALGSVAKQRAAAHRRRARIEGRHYDDAVSSGEHGRYWAWTPSWWRDGRLVPH